MKFEAAGMTFPAFAAKAGEMGAVVEAFLEGEKRSPSAQFRVDPLGVATPISTHDQTLGGENGGVFLGCSFPADAAYRLDIQEQGQRIAQKLARTRGAWPVRGRFRDGARRRRLAVLRN